MTFFKECLMAWRLWFTRGLLKKAQRWHRNSLIAQMLLQEREEGKWRERRIFAEDRVLGAEDEYDMAVAELRALTKGEV